MAMEIEVAEVSQAVETTTESKPAEVAAELINGDGVSAVSTTATSYNQEGEPPAIAAQSSTLVDSEPVQTATATVIVELSEAEIAEQRARAEQQYEAALAEAKDELSTLALARAATEVELKELKASEKAALKELKALISRGPIYPEVKTEQQAKIESAVANDKQSPSAIVVDDPNADTTWMQIKTKDVIQNIKGMGDKKLTAICELAPTLGDLEELRAAAGKAHKPFASVLPKGVGGSLADEIEEAICTAGWKHQAQLKEAKAKAALVEKVNAEAEAEAEAEDQQPEYVDVDDL